MASASNKILEIVCVLDVTCSMLRTKYDKTPLDVLNDQLRIFIDSLKSVPSITERAELSIITYTEGDPVEEVSYRAIDDTLYVPKLEARDGRTHTAHAVDYAINMIDQRLAVAGKFKHADPSILLLITDGNPDKNEDPAYRDRIIRKLNERTASTDTKKQILPFIVGVGKIDESTKQILAGYSKGFVKGYLSIENDQNTEERFRGLFQYISGSIRIAINNNNPYAEVPLNNAEGGTVIQKLNEYLDYYPIIIENV